MEIDLEFVLEGIGIGLDALILGLLFKSYESCTAYIDALKVMNVCHQPIWLNHVLSCLLFSYN